MPPSLKNIFKELNSDIGTSTPNHGSLMEWADQGVFLLNATLSVRDNQAGSHQNKGWEQFTDKVISLLSEKKKGLIFMLWGNYAKAKASLIDASAHYILTAAHPSPFSAYNGFLGCKHFSQTNNLLIQQGLLPINWQITSL
jgi:uracil-DNA glycosylase